MKNQVDQHRRFVTSEINEMVYMSNFGRTNYVFLAKKINEKSQSHFYDPLKILEKLGHTDYWLELPVIGAHIHLVFVSENLLDNKNTILQLKMK